KPGLVNEADALGCPFDSLDHCLDSTRALSRRYSASCSWRSLSLCGRPAPRSAGKLGSSACIGGLPVIFEQCDKLLSRHRGRAQGEMDVEPAPERLGDLFVKNAQDQPQVGAP